MKDFTASDISFQHFSPTLIHAYITIGGYPGMERKNYQGTGSTEKIAALNVLEIVKEHIEQVITHYEKQI